MKFCIQWLLCLPLFRNAVPAITVHSNLDVLLPVPIFRHACSTPITALLLDTDFLLQNTQLIDKEVLERMQASAQRLKSLVGASAPAQDEVFDVVEVITACSAFFSCRAEIITSTDIGKRSSILCRGSQLLFSEVLVCLVSNAIESYDAHQQKKVHITLKICADVIKISIKDTGCGMNKLEQWVSCFEGVSCKKQGSGIGLPFCIKTLKNNFNGTLLLRSCKNMGTTVRILLPLYSVHNM